MQLLCCLCRANSGSIGRLVHGASGAGEVIAPDGTPLKELLAQQPQNSAVLIDGFQVPEVGASCSLA